MGTSIFLWVEVRETDDRFRAVNDAGVLADPDAHALDSAWMLPRYKYEFALLGADMNIGSFAPIVPVRGLPRDAWPPTHAWMVESQFLCTSWFTAAELQAVDWTARVRHRTIAAFSVIRPFDVHDVQPFDELDDRSLDEIRGVLFPDGWTEIDPDGYPCVGELSLARAAPGLHGLMRKMVEIDPVDPERVRAVYGFDQLPAGARPL